MHDTGATRLNRRVCELRGSLGGRWLSSGPITISPLHKSSQHDPPQVCCFYLTWVPVSYHSIPVMCSPPSNEPLPAKQIAALRKRILSRQKTLNKLNTLIKAAGVPDVEPIWATLFAKALEGKDVKDMLLNVGSGGGAAAAAPAAGGAAAGGAAAAEAAPAEEEKEEGTLPTPDLLTIEKQRISTDLKIFGVYREGRVRRGYGLRSLRLSVRFIRSPLMYCPFSTKTSGKRNHFKTISKNACCYASTPSNR